MELTKKYFDGKFEQFTAMLKDRFDAQERRFTKRFDGVDAQLAKVDERLARLEDDVSKIKLAVLDYLATDRAVKNLVRQLKA